MGNSEELRLKSFSLLAMLLLSFSALAVDELPDKLNLTHQWVGYSAIGIFVLAYLLVILEEKLNLRKSKPVLLAAGIIWILIAFAYRASGDTESTELAIRRNFLEYAELFFFLLVPSMIVPYQNPCQYYKE